MQQAVEMVEICEQHNVQLMVNQNSCFVPGFLAIEPYINAEHLGEIYHVSITCNGFYTEFPERHLIPAMQVHHIGLVYKWFGEYESVYCQAHGHNRPIEDGEPFSVALFKSRSGIQGLLSCNWAFLANPGRNLQHPHEEIRIQGTKGAIYGNSGDMTVHLTEPKTREIKPSIEGTWFPDAFGNVMAHFFECLRTGKKPITHGRGNLHVVQTVFAMHQSASSGEVVLLDDISLDGDYDLSPTLSTAQMTRLSCSNITAGAPRCLVKFEIYPLSPVRPKGYPIYQSPLRSGQRCALTASSLSSVPHPGRVGIFM